MLVWLKGCYSREDQQVVLSRGLAVVLDENMALETVQQDNQRELEASQRMYVIRPRQTGLATVAALTHQAHTHAGSVLAVLAPSADETIDESVDRMSMTSILREAGAQVFDSVQAASDWIVAREVVA